MIKITLPRLISHSLLLWALILSVQSSAPDAATSKDANASAPDPKAASTKDVAAGECPDAANVDEHPLFGLLFLQLNKNYRKGYYERLRSGGDAQTEKFFLQWVDHFEPNVKRFKQRYFVNMAFAGNASKHLLFVGGPNELSPEIVTNEAYPHVRLAKRYGAALWALEHRYYGKSQPFGHLPSTNEMTWLNSHQAVEDIAYFLKMQSEYAVADGKKKAKKDVKSDELKWVLFSHSTPIALWFCQKYGDSYCHGVVSSSAVVQPAYSFYRYQKDVEDIYARAGGEECVREISAIIAKLRHLAQTEKGRAELSSILHLKPTFAEMPFSIKDLQHFYAQIATVFQAAVQYNGISSVGIDRVCKIVTIREEDEIRRLYRLLDLFDFNTDGLESRYLRTVEKLRNTGDSAEYRTARHMLWQMCNEFGHAPTTDYGSGWFEASIPNNFYLDMCTDVFGNGIDVEHMKNGLESTVGYFGPGIYAGKNAIIIAGDMDPWRSLFVSHAMHNASVRFVEITGAAHGANFLRPKQECVANSISQDKFDLLTKQMHNANEIMGATVERWLQSNADHGGISAKTDEKVIVEIARPKLPFRRTIKNWTAHVEFENETVNAQAELKSLFFAQQQQQQQAQSADAAPLSPLPIGNRQSSFTEQMEYKLHDALITDSTKAAAAAAAEESHVTKGKILQEFDHFLEPEDREGKSKERPKSEEVKRWEAQPWTQYFYRNNIYAKPGGPAFLIIGGEGPVNSHWVLNYWHSGIWAKKYGADLYALEHRFYGKSQPTGGNFSVDALRYLTAEQALADTAVFIKNMNERFNYSHWVVFGGSYAGNLAAWFRQKYPELAIGAIASSAPILAKVDFFEYKQVVQDSLKRYGTENCADNIEKFFALLEKAYMTKDGRKSLAKALKLCEDDYAAGWYGSKDWVDEHDFWMIGDNFGDNLISISVQYDDQDHRRLRQHCQKFEILNDFHLPDSLSAFNWTESAHLGTLTALAKALGMDGDQDGKCQHLSYQKDIERKRTLTAGGWRTWFWQTCNEYGFFQSTNVGRNIFESAIPVNLQIDSCTDVFGDEFDRNYIEERATFINNFYGGRNHMNASNIVFLNGSEDPWHYQSLIHASDVPDPSIKYDLIEGTSHCQDMISERPTDIQSLKEARLMAETEISKWLDAAPFPSKA